VTSGTGRKWSHEKLIYLKGGGIMRIVAKITNKTPRVISPKIMLLLNISPPSPIGVCEL
jgi:hypothetical protein